MPLGRQSLNVVYKKMGKPRLVSDKKLKLSSAMRAKKAGLSKKK